MEFSIEKCAMLIMRSEKLQMTEEKNYQTKKKSERSEKRKLTSTYEHWKRTPSSGDERKN